MTSEFNPELYNGPANAAAYSEVCNAVRNALTPAEALIEARNLDAKPGMTFDERTARRVINGLLRGIDSSKSFAKALANGEEVFVLRSIDRAAPNTILAWVDIAAQHGCGEEKLKDAHTIAWRWEMLSDRRWPS